MRTLQDSQAIRLSLASPDQIRSWSSGEVTRAATLNYRTLKPEKDGLLCERIFGPVKDWQCSCGRYRGYQKKGFVCTYCGVEVIRSDVRRERFGHIELAAPVAHIWYSRGAPSYLALLLGISPRSVLSVLSYASFIVTSVDEHGLEKARKQLAEEQGTPLILRPSSPSGNSNNGTYRSQTENGSTSTRAAERQDIEANRERELREATEAESAALVQLRTWMGNEAEDDVLFTPNGQMIVKRGLRVEPVHLRTLDRVCEAWRNTIAEQARRRLLLLAESERAQHDPLSEDSGGTANGARQVKKGRSKQELERSQRDLARLQRQTLLSEREYHQLKEDWGDLFHAQMGAKALLELLATLDLEKQAEELRAQARRANGQVLRKITRRLRAVEAFRQTGVSPERMILTVLPVLPPDLRPVVQLAGKVASSDLNELYLRVLARNDRVKELQRMGAPTVIMRNELRLLQEAVDALFDNGHGNRPVTGAGGALGTHRLRSLSALLRGKQGRFREDLLGKRVDYSGRSVIVVGPELKLHQCGLPKTMALELFKPFVQRELVKQNYCINAKSAKRFVERGMPEVWDILEEVIKGHPVLLNRAPTLHRLGIQAFEVVLVEGSAIHLHPLVCSSFNADFDGDQMAVHVPLSPKAQQEARTLLMTTSNLLSPANGEPVIGASQDMVLGCFYLTQERPNKKGEGRVFTDTTEAMLAYHHGVIDLQAPIKVRLDRDATISHDAPPTKPMPTSGKPITTTVGRIIFNEALPERLRFKNYAMKKENLKQVIGECFKTYGRTCTAELADEIKRLGFSYATRAGATIAISDVIVPTGKQEELVKADARIAELEEQYRDGLITDNEKYQQTVDAWNVATENVTKMVEGVLDPYGSIYTIAKSGATKAKFQQIRQLSGMRGLMASPSGRIIEVPIRGNFREGLTVGEYFISSHGARKGLADTALRTAESGYLTRRLIDVAQNVIVIEEDCGATEGILVTNAESREMLLPDMRERLKGRVLLEAIPGLISVKPGDELTEEIVEQIMALGVEAVRVRSVLGCLSPRGICRKCYGHDLATKKMVRLGTAVGIIAAQSIGEPGTQLTLRTFHTGGIAGAQGDITQGLPRVEELFEGRVPKDKAEISEIDGTVEITKDRETGTRTVRVVSTSVFFDEYQIPAGSQVRVQLNQHVQNGQVIVLLPPRDGHQVPPGIEARTAGEILSIQSDLLTVRFEEHEERVYPIAAGRTITVAPGQNISAGTPLTTGSPDPQAILQVLGRKGVLLYLVREVQRVYRNTGAYIDDKHTEVIARQMLRRVYIEDPGDTNLLPGELVDRFRYESINASVLAEGGEPATARAVLLGITKASLSTESWLAAASFRETKRVLTRAAIEAQVDHLVGLKEHVIIGKLIPAGTGWSATNTRATPKLEADTIEAKRGQEEACAV